MDQQWLPVFISLLTQIATLAIVMVGFLYNNGRMNDLRDMLRAEIAKNQSELLMKFAELENRLDTRLSRIESHMNLGWPRRHASTAPLQPSRTPTRTASARAQALPPT